MHVHIIQAHPEPNSFNGALTRISEQVLAEFGHTASVHDLYASGFDPVERGAHYACRADENVFAALGEQRHAWKSDMLPVDVRREIERLEWADLVIFQFPLWWHAPPAILKGWFDRVFINGGIYTSRMRYDTGYFRGRRAMVSVTTGAPQNAFGPGSRGGDFNTMLWPIHYSLHYVGYDVLPPFVSYGVQGHGYAYQNEARLKTHLKQTMDDWAARLSAIEELSPLRFPGWDDWDADGRALRLAG